MGGPGSGPRTSGYRPLSSECVRLDVREILRRARGELAQRCRMPVDRVELPFPESVTVSMPGTRTEEIALTQGDRQRPYFVCPRCACRVETLWHTRLPGWGWRCRSCARVRYQSHYDHPRRKLDPLPTLTRGVAALQWAQAAIDRRQRG